MIGPEPDLFAVLFGVQFCRFGRVIRGVMHVSLGSLGVVSGFFVSARLMMLGGFFVVTCGMLVMFGSLRMMLGCGHGTFCNSLFGHLCFSLFWLIVRLSFTDGRFKNCARLHVGKKTVQSCITMSVSKSALTVIFSVS